jgi:hypothetical protein
MSDAPQTNPAIDLETRRRLVALEAQLTDLRISVNLVMEGMGRLAESRRIEFEALALARAKETE